MSVYAVNHTLPVTSGVRTFTPSPLRALLPSVGGTKVMLGLVAMATTVDCLYASVKALVCAVEGNDMALKDMARTGGFKVSGGGKNGGWCGTIVKIYFVIFILIIISCWFNYSAPDPWDVAPVQVLPTQQPHPPPHSQSCWNTG